MRMSMMEEWFISLLIEATELKLLKYTKDSECQKQSQAWLLALPQNPDFFFSSMKKSQFTVSLPFPLF
jgi:hypothetical protein